MKYLTLLISIVLLSSAYPQKGIPQRPILTQTTVLPSGEGSDVYVSYRIANSSMVFEKSVNTYSAGINFSIEVTDSSGNFVLRQTSIKESLTSDFELTRSRSDYLQGLISFSLPPGKYNILPIVTDLRSNREVKLKIQSLSLPDSKNNSLYPPLLLFPEIQCNAAGYNVLTNFEGNIPLTPLDLKMIVPAAGTNLNNINVLVTNSRDTVFQDAIKISRIPELKLDECNDNIIVKESDAADSTMSFVLNGFLNNLSEGEWQFIFYDDDIKNPIMKEIINVVWYNKPLSLSNPEFAIKSLIHIEDEEVIDNLMKRDRDRLYDALFRFWKKYDPTSEDAYNPLMQEYYSRVDYAIENFRPISGKNGAFSDRGKIYIKYGNPQRTERTFNEKGKVIEMWFYQQREAPFRFIDNQGTGEFTLMN